MVVTARTALLTGVNDLHARSYHCK